MASVKAKFRLLSASGHEGAVYYQIIHERKIRHVSTPYRLSREEWRACFSMVSQWQREVLSVRIVSICHLISTDVERIKRIAAEMNRRGVHFTADEMVEEYHQYVRRYSLFNFMQSIIMSLRVRERLRTAETYAAALASFRRFRNGEDIVIDAINADIVEDYEAYLKFRGVTPNTTSFYMRILRAVYNRAVESGAVEQCHPFRHVYTGVGKTAKRALSLSVIRKIKLLDLSALPQADYARDMFMMSFYFRGMSFIDMAFLRKTDLRCGYITYRRRKTGQTLVIKWTADMQEILDKYAMNPTEYLLPIIISNGVADRVSYLRAGTHINYQLKKIAVMVGVTVPLTMYCARHSWASAARAKGVPVSIISEGMGHDSEATTRIYLEALDTSSVDKANDKILRSL